MAPASSSRRLFSGQHFSILMAAAKSSSVTTTSAAVTTKTGITKPVPVSTALAKFLGASESSRTGAVKNVWEYIKLHDLQSPSMATRHAFRLVQHSFCSSGKVLSEEEKAVENVFIKKMEQEKLGKLARKQFTGDAKSVLPGLHSRWGMVARPFCSKPTGSGQVIGIDLGTTNSRVAVKEGKKMEQEKLAKLAHTQGKGKETLAEALARAKAKRGESGSSASTPGLYNFLARAGEATMNVMIRHVLIRLVFFDKLGHGSWMPMRKK